MISREDQRRIGLYVALPLILAAGALLGVQSCNHRLELERQRQEQALEAELRENPDGEVARRQRRISGRLRVLTSDFRLLTSGPRPQASSLSAQCG